MREREKVKKNIIVKIKLLNFLLFCMGYLNSLWNKFYIFLNNFFFYNFFRKNHSDLNSLFVGSKWLTELRP